ncbi:MAG: TRAP transporter small permease [Nitratireductor sp.]|nr:TRAP transporter small permease [Nitratireductor sp.]
MTSQASKHPLRKFLDGLYNAGGIAAAICLVAILVVIIAQMVTRWSNISVPGLSEYAGYLMASASFLAFAHALNSGSHIRVNLFITALGNRKFWGELWCMIIGTAASAYLAWYAMRLVYWSRKLGDLSQGQDATPMWIVQTPMAVGAVLLAICFADNLVTLILRGRDNIGSDTVAQSHGE